MLRLLLGNQYNAGAAWSGSWKPRLYYYNSPCSLVSCVTLESIHAIDSASAEALLKGRCPPNSFPHHILSMWFTPPWPGVWGWAGAKLTKETGSYGQLAGRVGRSHLAGGFWEKRETAAMQEREVALLSTTSQVLAAGKHYLDLLQAQTRARLSLM